VQTSGADETEALGAELATALRPGDLVLVRGELGAGKTTLVRGAARALGVIDPVTSPTYSVGHRYRADGVTIAHLDLYRLADLEQEEPDLLADYMGPDQIAFVEWPPSGAAELRGARMVVTIEHAGEDERRVEMREPAERGGDAGVPPVDKRQRAGAPEAGSGARA
jgi:tRNA threonylcarbamoyladenosine biosynthesis protein TsaE